jgi:hypothetical protein
MLPTNPLHPNQSGNTPNKIIGRYSRVKLGSVTENDNKKKTEYSDAVIAIMAACLDLLDFSFAKVINSP